MKKILQLLLMALAVSVSCANAATIAFQDEFDTSAAPWTITLGNVAFKSGDHANATINTSGTDDHSGLHFNADGTTFNTSNVHYAALNAGNNTVASMSTTISLTAGTTYNIYFRYAGALSGSQNIRGTLELGAESATTGTLTASLNAWKSGNFSFTPTTSGSATLTFANVTVPANSDLLLDSVLVAAIPEPNIAGLFGITGLLALIRRRRHV